METLIGCGVRSTIVSSKACRTQRIFGFINFPIGLGVTASNTSTSFFFFGSS